MTFAKLASSSTNSALSRLGSHGYAKQLAWVLGFLLLAVVLGLWLTPWQQNIMGKGEVIVFSPMERPQTINAQIDARIAQWHVTEGEWVNQGDALLSLEEVKTDYLDPNQLARLQQERDALTAQQQAIQQQLGIMGSQLVSQQTLQQAAVPAAQLKISQAEQKIAASKQKLAAAEQSQATAQINLSRREELYANGLRSKRDLELAQLAVAKAEADVQEAKSSVDIANQERSIASFATGEKTAETNIKQQDVMVKQASLAEKSAKLTQDIAKLNNKLASLKQRQEQREIHATVSGQVTRVFKLGKGETVKADTPLIKITPQTNDLAAALYVADWNAPLLSVGRPVRLQFAGFPAIQFAGWPGVSRGTFAGTIVAIDATDDGASMYRILVKPDKNAVKNGTEEPWPDSTVLRPGSQALGWVLLDTVPIWFELWRQFNGFAPTVSPTPDYYGMKPTSFGPHKDPFKDDAKLLKTVKKRK